jgi:hypothetical protein
MHPAVLEKAIAHKIIFMMDLVNTDPSHVHSSSASSHQSGEDYEKIASPKKRGFRLAPAALPPFSPAFCP